MGASSWWGTTNRQPPLAFTPNWLTKLMLIWPHLNCLSVCRQLFAMSQAVHRKLTAIPTKKNKWSTPFNASTINGTSNNLGSSQKTKQLFKTRARFCSFTRGTSIELLPQRTCPNERRGSNHFLCLCNELSMCINARPHKPPWPNQNHQLQKSQPKRSRLLLCMARKRMAWVVKKFCLR